LKKPVLVAAVLCAALDASARPPQYSPTLELVHPTNLYWGDTHLHTNNSPDAYSLGNTTLTPDDAYRFAKGETLEAAGDQLVRLHRPLDFLVVSDHAEFLGIFRLLDEADPQLLNTALGKRWYEAHSEHAGEGEFSSVVVDEFVAAISGHPDPSVEVPRALKQSIWDEVVAAAERAYEPGRFTSFAGYEWSSMPDGNNLHRVVVFKDDADKTGTIVPFSGLDSIDPEDLWAFLRRYEADTGGEALVIPHNSNVSNGLMFATTMDGRSLDPAYARERMHFEKIVEVTQVKGDSEAHPKLSPDDEFADFETWDRGNIMLSAAKEDHMLRFEYARSALKLGLELEREMGANPYQFGMIGATDNHTSMSTAREDNFFGKFIDEGPNADRVDKTIVSGERETEYWENWRLGASGYAGVWAQENTRESLFAAMQRRETYATTGSRIVLRFFAGFDYPADMLERVDWVHLGYEHGVPMGGELEGGDGRAPTLVIAASKDPDGANLDRVQVVKGWLGPDGKAREKIFDVALSDGRTVDPATGRAPPVGSTVNVAEATYDNSIGAPQLGVVWEDPEFDASRPAFYYVRVIEIPKPRWTAYDAKFFGLDLPDEIPMTVQDRAYSSPVWYTP